MSNLQLLPADLAAALEGKPDWLLKSALAAWESRQAREVAKKTPSESPLTAPCEEPLRQQSGPIMSGPRKANLVSDLIASVQATLRNPNKQTTQPERALQPPNPPPPPPAQGRAVNLSRFEWRDLIEKADRTLEQHGDPKALGPARKLLVYLLALAIKHGARQHPTREAHVFKPVWELAADMIALGWFRTQKVDHAARTIRGWLANPRYRHELRAWLAWEEWMTTDPELQQYLAKEKDGKPPVALVGGMLWRVRVRPIRRKPSREIRVLAPYLRLPWRDLAADRQAGRTQKGLLPEPQDAPGEAHTALDPEFSGLTNTHLVKERDIITRVIVGEALPALFEITPLVSLNPENSRTLGLAALLNPAGIRPGRYGRKEWANRMARIIAAALGDQHSLGFWLKVLWSAMRALAYGGGPGALSAVYRAVQVAQEARAEGRARKPGALAQHLLGNTTFLGGKLTFWDMTGPYAGLKVGA